MAGRIPAALGLFTLAAAERHRAGQPFGIAIEIHREGVGLS